MKKIVVFIILFVVYLTAGCNNIAGQDYTFVEKLIGDFDETKAEQMIIEHEQKVLELSEHQTIHKDQFIEYRKDIEITLGSDFGSEIANSFFDIADIEDSKTQELTRSSLIIYPSLINDNIYLESANIVELVYKDPALSIKTYLKISILSSEKQLDDFYRIYYFEKTDDDWNFSHIDGVLTYAY